MARCEGRRVCLGKLNAPFLIHSKAGLFFFMDIEKLEKANELLRQIGEHQEFIADLTSDERPPFRKFIGDWYSGVWVEEAEKAVDRTVIRLIKQLMDLNEKLEAV